MLHSYWFSSWEMNDWKNISSDSDCMDLILTVPLNLKKSIQPNQLIINILGHPDGLVSCPSGIFRDINKRKCKPLTPISIISSCDSMKGFCKTFVIVLNVRNFLRLFYNFSRVLPYILSNRPWNAFVSYLFFAREEFTSIR